MKFGTISAIGTSYAVLQAVGLYFLYSYISHRIGDDPRDRWVRLFRWCFVLATLVLTVGLLVAFWQFPPQFEAAGTPLSGLDSDASLMYAGLNGALVGFALLIVALGLGVWLGTGQEARE